MESKIIEASNGGNWGKFMLLRFTPQEYLYRSALPDGLGNEGAFLKLRWDYQRHILIVDLETGEGAMFRLGGVPAADLDEHRIWVCPLFEPFLGWLYEQDCSDLQALPAYVELPDAPFALHGTRRPGPSDAGG
jgi:hypothetical protein